MKKPYLVGISGGSGSGKTTLIRKLSESFSSDQLCLISQDDYYRPIEEQFVDDQGIQNFDLPTSIDEDAFSKDVLKLMQGITVKRQEYMFNNSEAAPKTLVFKPAPIVIVEGLFVFYYAEIAKNLDLKVFVQAKENLKIIRRIKRDKIERNYPLDDVLYRYEHHVSPSFEKYINPYLDEVDLIVNNNSNCERATQVLMAYLNTKLT